MKSLKLTLADLTLDRDMLQDVLQENSKALPLEKVSGLFASLIRCRS